jgi:hypothetical protein
MAQCVERMSASMRQIGAVKNGREVATFAEKVVEAGVSAVILRCDVRSGSSSNRPSRGAASCGSTHGFCLGWRT